MGKSRKVAAAAAAVATNSVGGIQAECTNGIIQADGVQPEVCHCGSLHNCQLQIHAIEYHGSDILRIRGVYIISCHPLLLISIVSRL